MTAHNYHQLQHLINLLGMLGVDEYCSGTQLAQELGVSRAYVWKLMKQLEDFGLTVISRSGKGYRLEHALQWICPGRLQDECSTSDSLLDIDYHLITYSTNKQLKEHFSHNKVVIAEHQTAGRGRRGRDWVSPIASNLYWSFGWRSQRPVQQLGGLSLVVGLSVARALEELGVSGLQLKWPNDLRVAVGKQESRKLAGILIELSGDTMDSLDCVIGVGLNVAMPSQASTEIDQPWADLTSILPQADRQTILATCLKNIQQYLQQFESDGFEAFIPLWQRYDECFGKPVRILQAHGHVDGVGAGVDSSGALLLDTGEAVIPVYAGDVSLRFQTMETDG